jgi:hypothetical protein
VPERSLERELRALGAGLAVPAAPDLAPAVRARLDERPVRRPLVRRRLVVVLAALALAAAAAMAVPQARTAILEFLRIQGATVRRVEQPPAAPRLDLGLAVPVNLEAARERLAFEPLIPDFPGLGRPDRVYVDRAAFGGQIVFLYGSEDRPRLLVSEFRSDLDGDFIAKEAGPGSSIESVTVGDAGPGFWVAGEPHLFMFRDSSGNPKLDTVRLSANALIWQHGRLTLRIEGEITKERALVLAETLVER